MPSPVHPYSDYGVAMRTLRESRGWLGLLLFVCVLAQFLGFSLMWWTKQPYDKLQPGYVWSALGDILLPPKAAGPAPGAATTETATAARAIAGAGAKAGTIFPGTIFPDTVESQALNVHKQWHTTYSMLVPLTQIAALIAVLSQSIIVFVTLLVVLIAQAPGVAQITRSLIWSVLLLFMFFPWQYLAKDFPIPGVIYSYTELLRYIRPLVAGPLPNEVVYPYQWWLVYVRFMVWPMVGLFVLLITSERYRAGVMIAIGHPLQSILQPRGAAGVTPALGAPAAKPRPLAPLGGGAVKR